MTVLQELTAKTRRELGDFGHAFSDTFVGTGDTSEFDLTETQIVDLAILHVTTLTTASLIEGTHYVLDRVNGTLFLQGALAPLPQGDRLIVTGKTYGMFSDDELAEYVHDAFIQHTAGRLVSKRYRSQEGFIRFAEKEMGTEDLPEVEVLLVALLATIEALWALTTDASTDIDIQTADGTVIPRSVRYAQMRNQIDVLTEKYTTLCAQLNVGLHRIEVNTLRRVSRTTGRLVPLFAGREYDDNSMPERLLPPIDKPNIDDSGVASPIYGGVWS